MKLEELRNPVVSSLVLVVAESEEISRRIESYLRNHGLPMRSDWASNLPEVEGFLAAGTPDLVLCASDLAALSLTAAVAVLRGHDPDLPVVALAPNANLAQRTELLKSGVRDLVSDENLEQLAQLAQVCTREIQTYGIKRELRRVQARLATFESRHQQLVSGTADAVVQVQEGIIAQANAAFAALVGSPTPDELVGTPLMDAIHPNSQPQVKTLLKQLAKTRDKTRNMNLSCQLLHSGGEPVEVDVQLTTGLVDGEQLVEMLIRAEAVAAAAPATAIVEVQGPAAPVESTSDLPDRKAFIRALTEQLDHDPQSVIGYAVLDEAEQVEQRLGYDEAEDLALELGRLLRNRAGDAVNIARFAPLEYALWASGDFEAVRKRMDQLRETVRGELLVTPNHETSATVSIALSAPLGNLTAQARLSTAIAEARSLSANGGNRVALAKGTGDKLSGDNDEERIVGLLQEALAANRVRLAFQLIASLEGDTRHHFDVLVRISDSDGHELAAASFVAVAERHGLMKEVDRRVFVLAMEALNKRRAGRENPMMFLKLSEDTLRHGEDYLAWLREKLAGERLPSGDVCFEVQELVLQNNVRAGRALLKALRDLGATIAIEHYGLGSASIQLLDHIPVSFLKFDKSFTHNFNDRETQRRMANLMDVAKQRNVKTIVSHVEDANIMARMWQMGVNFIQGYQVQEPEVVQLTSDGR